MTEQSLAVLTGHDLEAMQRISDLGEVYRREGLPGLRAACEDLVTLTTISLPDLGVLVAEAVLTISERTGTSAATRRAWEHRLAEEARDEAEQIQKGGAR